jgi:CBS domain-containing protein
MVTNPITVGVNMLVFEVAKLMSEKEIGSVIVAENGKVLGIATERDLVRRVMAENKDSKTVKISEVMSSPVISISPRENVAGAAKLMASKGVRRLVVLDDEKLVGIITTNDLTKNMGRLVEEFATTLFIISQQRGHFDRDLIKRTTQ